MELHNLNLFKILVREGKGVGNAARLTGNSFEKVDAALRRSATFRTEITSMHIASISDMVVMSASASQTKDAKTFVQLDRAIRAASVFRMYGDCKAKYLNGELIPSKVAEALAESAMDKAQAAYYIGIEYDHLSEFLTKNPAVGAHARKVI